jgi:hypothetical protein
MKLSTEYQRFADECRRFAQQARTDRERKILEEMAEAWDELSNRGSARDAIQPS